ncbi:transposase [Myroides odoratimimus]|uniref:Transposase n=2 Tax=Myroides odoratimimus TaxID=76832 RepID=A0AAI8C6I2_9FLAO|nr:MULTISPECIES: transposase [Myroides]AJA70114.1 Transposase [Myroides sp. A21]ALU26830.1 transposase [Myroides odoratimimus]QBK76333.1 DDE transposase [Myroides odoratimimus]WHT75065.1 transposase [Myroides odoratimimus]WHU39650.1 transposase [Myroides odoratimimus]
MADTKVLSCKAIGELFGVKGEKFQRQYKHKTSGFKQWDQQEHAQDWLLYPENITNQLSIDEVCLSMGELYTILTSKAGKGQKKTIVAIVKGTKSDTVIKHLSKLPKKLRDKVTEITLDMAGAMKQIAKKCFPKAVQVIDRFHVQKLVSEAVQDIRIKYRWAELDAENTAVLKAKEEGIIYNPEILSNGDTKKQLLVRSRSLLYKNQINWTSDQQERAKVLFELYPEIKQAYLLANNLRQIYNLQIDKEIAMTKLAHWFNDIEKASLKHFSTVLKTFNVHYNEIINYFINRSTNASAESFNAKIKYFRMMYRGVRDKKFFLFRLTRLFA